MRIRSFSLEHNRKIINSWGRELLSPQLNYYLSRETRWQKVKKNVRDNRNHAKMTSSSLVMARRVRAVWRRDVYGSNGASLCLRNYSKTAAVKVWGWGCVTVWRAGGWRQQ